MAISISRRLGMRSPRVKRALWKGWYNLLAGRHRQADWTFMNYGYVPSEGDGAALALQVSDEPDRSCIQLYHHVAGAIDVRDRAVLEVGCGRGGGASYIARYMNPSWMLGVDFSPWAIQLCRRLHAAPRLSFRVGDAESLPCDDAQFDAVVNVESSHCYGSVPTFLREVFRVLAPGGHFLWADLGSNRRLDAVRRQFAEAGFLVRRETVITPNVLAAMDEMSERRMQMIRQLMPRFLVRRVSDFAGVKGTRVYESLRTGDVQYVSAVLQKP